MGLTPGSAPRGRELRGEKKHLAFREVEAALVDLDLVVAGLPVYQLVASPIVFQIHRALVALFSFLLVFLLDWVVSHPTSRPSPLSSYD